MVPVGDWQQAGHNDAGLGVGHAERIDEGAIVRNKLVAIVGPVARIGIVDAKVNHHNVGSKVHGLAELRLFGVRPMSTKEQCGTGSAEISYFIFLAQHLL